MINWFVVDDSFIFLIFLLIVYFCFFLGLCLLMFSFALYFWCMGSHPWFLYKTFFSYIRPTLVWSNIMLSFIHPKLQIKEFPIQFVIKSKKGFLLVKKKHQPKGKTFRLNKRCEIFWYNFCYAFKKLQCTNH
jgi:hypothetical protein